MMVLQLDDDKQRQCRILRVRTEGQLQQLHASMSVIHADGGRSYAAMDPTSCDAVKGRLRMARRGTTLFWLFAENDSTQFRLFGSEEVSDRPSVPDTLLLHTLCNGSGETQVLWKSIILRAERMTLPPGPAERPSIDLYSMNSDGSNLKKLAAPLKGFVQIASAEWSGDGTRLVGDMSNGGTETSRIVVMNSDGSNMRDLGPGCMPSLSPDKKEVVFSQPSSGIMRMNADGSSRKLVDPSGWGTQWSPNGKSIAWASGSNVVLLDPKTNKRRQLLTAEQSAQLSYVYWNLGWSLDSKSIAFKARKADRTGDVLAVADVDSTAGFRIIYAGPDRINEDLTWHPDGRDVVVSLLIPPSKTSKLFLINRDTPAAPKLLPGQPADWNVLGSDWSPDGTTIAFSAQMPPQPVEWPLTD